MAILALDLGGTKLSTAVFSASGEVMWKGSSPLHGRTGVDVSRFILTEIEIKLRTYEIDAIGVSVPGISHQKTGTVWAPNIEGWNDYPLREDIKRIVDGMPVRIDSDRACSIFGEQWHGNANGCQDVVFISVGTGIGAGILAGGNLIRGSHDIAGAIGWWALQKPFESKYIPCGCFEYYASGAGIPRLTRELLRTGTTPSILRNIDVDEITAYQVFEAYDGKDPVAIQVLDECILYWGMAAANLVSIFNPEKIIFGGGIFGPASKLIDVIKYEAAKWSQPVSIKQVSFEVSALGPDAALHGAAFLAQKKNSVL
jgi:glucokinase